MLGTLAVDPRQGLGSAEATRRHAAHGPNLLRSRRPISAFWILARQLQSAVVALLGAACALSLAFARWLEAAAIAVVLLLNTTIGFLTELRATRSMEGLRRLGQVAARVRRDGAVHTLPADRLVPGDVVLLEAGDVVTADLRLVAAAGLQVDESTFTGESEPVTKSEAPVDAGTVLADRSCMVWKGTAVTRGSGSAVVVATGMATELGRMAGLVEEAGADATPLERRLAQLGHRLIWLTLAVALVTAAVGIARGRDPTAMVETAVALAIAAIPEGLPVVATLALARGLWRLAHRQALVNRLSAVETLGATSVILSDKTGTLTENRMAVARLALPGGDVEVEAGVDGVGRADLRSALEIAVLCNNASPAEAERPATGDPTELALLLLGERRGVDRGELLRRFPRCREEAFDPATRAMATVHRDGDGFRVAVKGAAESILPACTHQFGADGRPADLDERQRDRWRQRSRELADGGLRVLALAGKSAARADVAAYEGLTLVALAGLRDPPRREVAQALDQCRAAGVRVVMVTGDQAGTAAAIARSLGLGDPGTDGVVEGADLPDLAALGDEERHRLLAVPVFARVAPEQKLSLIRLHQEGGAVVAMTGDGVNDAPALRQADIGVAMGKRGTQVAREAADMVLLDDSFGTIVAAIRQGRAIFTNIRRFVVYLLSCNLSEVLVVSGATLLGLPLPLLPLQILFLNLVTDVFPALALGFGAGHEGLMRQPPRPAAEPLVSGSAWLVIGAYGLLIAASVLGGLLSAVHGIGMDEPRAVTVSFLVLALAQVWHPWNLRGRGTRLFRNDVLQNRWVWGATAICLLLLLAAVQVPLLGQVLETVDPGPAGWLLALGWSLLPVVVGQGLLVLRADGGVAAGAAGRGTGWNDS